MGLGGPAEIAGGDRWQRKSQNGAFQFIYVPFQSASGRRAHLDNVQSVSVNNELCERESLISSSSNGLTAAIRKAEYLICIRNTEENVRALHVDKVDVIIAFILY